MVVRQRPASNCSVRAVHMDGSSAPEFYGGTYNGFVMGDGNPTDPWGVELSVVKAAWATRTPSSR